MRPLSGHIKPEPPQDVACLHVPRMEESADMVGRCWAQGGRYRKEVRLDRRELELAIAASCTGRETV